MTLPYWDQTGEWERKHGLPWCLTVKEFKFKKIHHHPIPNPLRTFKLPVAIVDETPDDDGKEVFSKHKGYEIERFPRSGLVGTEKDRKETAAHNAKYSDHEGNKYLINILR